MRQIKTPIVVAGVAVSFIGLAATIIYLSATKIIGHELAKFMLAGELGLYVGFGILIGVYRLIRKLE